jgi:hypothetical protein
MTSESDSNHKPEERPSEPPSPPPIPPNDATVLGDAEATPSNNRENETERLLRGTRTLEWLQFSVNGALAVIGIIAICIYGGQLNVMRRTLLEMERQGKLMRQQLEGTMAAILTFQEPIISTDPTNKEELTLHLSNSGHVIAQDTYIDFQVDTASFPKLTTVYPSQSYTVSPQVGIDGWSDRYPLPYLSPQDMKFSTQKRTVTVKGTFEFDNGFGRRYKREFCFSYTGSYQTRSDSGGEQDWGGNFLPCDMLKGRVAYFLTHPWK